MVRRAHPQPGVDLTYIKFASESNGSAGDQYTGLDRFGRVVDQRWTDNATPTPVAKDHRQYGYDRDSNRLYSDNLVSSSNSELYAYDGLNQITSFDRGTLNGTKDGISGTPARTQSWDFDALGNLDSQTTDGTAQTRSANDQNEITSISGATTPSYDANGNTLQDDTGLQYVWDAWNRMVTVKSINGHRQQCTYDANGKLITHGFGAGTADKGYDLSDHIDMDVEPFKWAQRLDGWGKLGKYTNMYLQVGPIGKNNCPKNP